MRPPLLAATAVFLLAASGTLPPASAACVASDAVCDAIEDVLAQLEDSLGPLGGVTLDGDATSPTFLCSQEYDHGVLRTADCPPDLCGLNIGVVAVTATGTASGSAPVGLLECHDASHAVTGSLATPAGPFDELGGWSKAKADRIIGGTHPHCTLSSIGDADYAFVQCGKV